MTAAMRDALDHPRPSLHMPLDLFCTPGDLSMIRPWCNSLVIALG